MVLGFFDCTILRNLNSGIDVLKFYSGVTDRKTRVKNHMFLVICTGGIEHLLDSSYVSFLLCEHFD